MNIALQKPDPLNIWAFQMGVFPRWKLVICSLENKQITKMLSVLELLFYYSGVDYVTH